jgi:hypothetical protein
MTADIIAWPQTAAAGAADPLMTAQEEAFSQATIRWAAALRESGASVPQAVAALVTTAIDLMAREGGEDAMRAWLSSWPQAVLAARLL